MLPAHHRFRTDEAAYGVEPSRGEPVRSFGRLEPPPIPAPAPVRLSTASSPPSAPRGRSPALLIVAAVVALMVVALVLIRPWTSTDCLTTPPTATTTTTVGADVAGSNPVAPRCS